MELVFSGWSIGSFVRLFNPLYSQTNRALADQIEGDQRKHPEYRRLVCNCLEHNRYKFGKFMETDFDEYLAASATSLLVVLVSGHSLAQ